MLRRALSNALPLYEIPHDDLVGEVLIPGVRAARSLRIGAGFFSSHCLAQIAPGLAAYLTAHDKPLQLLVSPELGVDEQIAIERGLRDRATLCQAAAKRLLHQSASASALANHTLECLAYLIAADRLQLRVILMKRGMYHKKVWLLADEDDRAAVHGSGNATARGLLVNGEQMSVDRAWADGAAAVQRIELLNKQWERQWNNRDTYSLAVEYLQALPLLAKGKSNPEPPTLDDFWAAWNADHNAGLEPPMPPNVSLSVAHRLRIPKGLEWRSGPYRHQGEAVDAFTRGGARGILAIATGGGKTKTALICAEQLQGKASGALLVVILVPSKPLLRQWASDVKEFGVSPVLPSDVSSAVRNKELAELHSVLAASGQRTEVVICTNQLFISDERLRSSLSSPPAGTCLMLIADEVHNLGAPGFRRVQPEEFTVRLGLSATPVRQYDGDGTDALFKYFGDRREPLFEFGLREAIDTGCLVPYRYVLHEVGLTEEEFDKYIELTEELRSAGFRVHDSGQAVIANEKVEHLLRLRRALVEQAAGKLPKLIELLQDVGPQSVRRTLVYASAKASVLEAERQIVQLNRALSTIGVISHQLTSEETSSGEASELLTRFGVGDYQVLTAMKVLDEGVDIPQTDTAYILASSTVEREWVQRRGRILRRANGKVQASLHDFAVVPPRLGNKAARSILRSELRRAEAFAELAVNEWAADGPRSVMKRLEDMADEEA